MMVLATQSMMYPENEQRIGRVLRAASSATGSPEGGAAPIVFAEAIGTRHQEASDFACLAYYQLRLSCMAGALPPDVALRRHCDPMTGFLAAAGAQPKTGSPLQARAAEMVSGWMGVTAERGGSGDVGGGYLLHA